MAYSRHSATGIQPPLCRYFGHDAGDYRLGRRDHREVPTNAGRLRLARRTAEGADVMSERKLLPKVAESTRESQWRFVKALYDGAMLVLHPDDLATINENAATVEMLRAVTEARERSGLPPIRIVKNQ